MQLRGANVPAVLAWMDRLHGPLPGVGVLGKEQPAGLRFTAGVAVGIGELEVTFLT